MTQTDANSTEEPHHELIEAAPALVAVVLTVYSGVVVGDWIMTVGAGFFVFLAMDWGANRAAIRTTTRRLQELTDNVE